MLERLQGRTHHMVTGICLLHLHNHRQAVFAESSAVTFHPLDDLKTRRYLNRVNPLDNWVLAEKDLVNSLKAENMPTMARSETR